MITTENTSCRRKPSSLVCL